MGHQLYKYVKDIEVHLHKKVKNKNIVTFFFSFFKSKKTEEEKTGKGWERMGKG